MIKLTKILFVMFSIVFASCCRAEIIDNLDSTLNLTAVSNSSVSANGNSTVSMAITATGDSVVNWYDYSYVRFRIYNDRLEVQPTAQIASGQYSLYIRYYNSSKIFLGEVQWADITSSTGLQVLPSVAALAVANGISGVEYFYLRFKLHGGIGDGFIFDKISAKEGPTYWPPTPLTATAPKAVFGHEMVGFSTPQYSGHWDGWNTYGHNPTALDANGKPDIASVCYPLVGYYDMADPKLVEYHCQSFKMACMDGVIFDLAFYTTDTAMRNMMSNYLSIMNDYDMKGVVCYEDKCHWLWDSPPTRAEAVQRAYADMTGWLNSFIASGTQYYVTGTRPLFLMFSYEISTSLGTSCLSPSEITTWLNTFAPENRPVIIRQYFKDPEHIGVLNGRYGWPMLNYPVPPELYPPYVGYCDIDDNNSTLESVRSTGQYLLTNGYADFHIPSVWPGFNDYAVNGWGSGPRLMPRYDGQLYQNTWNWAVEDNLPVVQIATWNDWFEATIIEPAVEFGYKYLQITSDRASEFKGITDFQAGDFNVPVWIYRLKDVTNDPCVLGDLTAASNYIKAGQFQQAKNIVSFWANHFDIDSVVYWTGPGSITTEPNIQASTLDFGSIPLGTSDIKSVIVSNTGTGDLLFTGSPPIYILAGAADYSIVPPLSTAALGPAQSRQIQIKFQPTVQGVRTGVLRIRSNDLDQPILNVNLNGTAEQAGDYFPDSRIDFKDFAIIASGWQNEYSFEDLKLLADNWLEQ